MTTCEREFDFTLVLTDIPELTESVENALFEAGCDDATIAIRSGRLFLTFSRTAPSVKDAIISAIRDVRRAKIGADVLRVDYCNLVTQSEIARRASRSRQQINQYIGGVRGSGKFPPPACNIADGAPLWYWCEVANWLVQNGMLKSDVLRDAEEFDAINGVLEFQRQQHERASLVTEILRSIFPRKVSSSIISALKETERTEKD
jgi:hypothetical protein